MTMSRGATETRFCLIRRLRQRLNDLHAGRRRAQTLHARGQAVMFLLVRSQSEVLLQFPGPLAAILEMFPQEVDAHNAHAVTGVG